MKHHVWILVIFSCLTAVLGSDCVFPLEWRGRWHQGRRIDISINSITRRGTCVEKHRNKYLMLNKDYNNRKCFRCLVFTQWHPNLLQYKESHCWYEKSFHQVCSLINGDAPLHTLVRIPSIPQACPFQGSYTFSYVNGTGNTMPCANPLSEVRACADESKFKFIFKHCQGVYGTYDKVMDFQCLATWESGEKLLYGSFSTPTMASADEYMYRCFMHSFYGTNGDMAMSADRECQGLQSPTLGVITMKFTKELNEWSRNSCRFPDVLVTQNTWRDLSGRWRLDVDDGLQTLRLKDRTSGDVIRYSESADTSTTRLVIRCVDKTQEAETINGDKSETVYTTYVTNDTCESGFQCVKLIRRDMNVLEMYLGDVINSTEHRCSEHNFRTATKHILIPDVNDSGPCSITRKGTYTYTDKASRCSGTVDIGCDKQDEIVIETDCPENLKKVEILQCVYSWTSDSKTYLIVQQPQQNAKCLTFIDTDFGVELQSDDSCQSDRWTVTNQYLNYLLYTPPGSCKVKEVQSDQNVDAERIQGDSDTNNVIKSCAWRTTFSYFLLLLPCIGRVLLRIYVR